MPRERKRQNVRSTACLSQEQAELILSHVRESATRARRGGGSRPIVDEIVILCLLHAGLRPRELCTLRIADTPAHHGRPELRIQGGGTLASRAVSIPSEIVRAFERFVRLHRKGAKPKEPLLLSERGTPFSYMSLYSKVHRIGRETGVAHLHPALLRHTFLVRLYEKEQDLRLIQDQAGHARLKSTARYVRPRSCARECDACGKRIPAGGGERIDSGQVLCPSCLSDLRNR